MTLRNKVNSLIPNSKRKQSGRTVKVTDAELKEALEHSLGNFTVAKQYLRDKLKTDVDRSTIGKRVKIEPALVDVCNETKETLLDLAERNVAKGIIAGDPKYTRYYLDRQGKQRGYTTKVENEISNPEGDVFRVAPFNVEGKTREEIMQMVKEAWGK